MIRRWLNRLVHWADGYSGHEQLVLCSATPHVTMPTPLRFKVQQATGGTIVEITHYDRKRDEEHVNLHIIPDSETDMPHAIARIVTIELLKA